LTFSLPSTYNNFFHYFGFSSPWRKLVFRRGGDIKSQPRLNKLRALSIILTVFLLSAALTTAVYAATITTTVDSAGNVGYHTSLALNNSGYPSSVITMPPTKI
jgi:hypothetical protein